MSVIESLPIYISTEIVEPKYTYGRSFENFDPKNFITHNLIDRYNSKLPYLRTLVESNFLSAKVIDNNQIIINYLDLYLPNSNDKEIFFEEDDDNSIVNFIEINNYNIILNVYEDRIEYSFENEEKQNSLIVGQIAFEREKIINLINELIHKGGLNNQLMQQQYVLSEILPSHQIYSGTSI